MTSGGEPQALLSSVLERERPLSLQRFFRIAIALAELCHERHTKPAGPSLLLARLHPRSLRVQEDGEELRAEAVGPAPSGQREALVYTAPELTGRMGPTEGPDERTDLYLLGVVLYEMLAGKPPFDAGAPLELIHAHLAKRPPPLRRVAPAVPEPLDAIVQRLLAKTRTSRYQSAFGLAHDLRRCREGAPFALGERDRSGRLSLPDALYGREGDLGAALGACRRTLEGGVPTLVAVRGPPGSGKTFFVRELGRTAVALGLAGRFLVGKADQYNQAPGAVWFSALEDLVCQLLVSAAEVPKWRAAMLDALRDNARLLVDVAPAAKLLLGPGLPPLPEASASESQARFKLTFEGALRAAAAGGPPLIVLLDDAQWAGSDPLALADHLLSRPSLPIVICVTYRDSEVVAGHPAADFLARARERYPSRVLDIAMGPMDLPDCRRLVADALKLRAGDEAGEALAEALVRKTSGNPLHVIQFLRVLHERRALRFDFGADRWTWDQAQVDATGEGASVLEIVALSIGALPPETQSALQAASCWGVLFDARLLAAVLGCSEEEVLARLRPALAAGLVRQEAPRRSPPASPSVPNPQREAGGYPSKGLDGASPPPLFAFRHDKIQQAAHDAIPPRELAPLCFRAGLVLHRAHPDPAEAANLFDAANLLNAGLAEPLLLQAPAGTLQSVARLNAAAARRARDCTAYPRAAEYAACGLRALALAAEGGAPAPEPDLPFTLTLLRAESEYLQADFAAAEASFDAAVRLAASPAQRAQVCRMRIALLSSMGQFQASISLGLEAMRELWGVHIPLDATVEAFEEEMDLLLDALRLTRPAALADVLFDLPECLDPGVLDLMQVGGVAALSAAYVESPALFGLIPARCLRLSLKHGRAPQTPYLAAILGQVCAISDRFMHLCYPLCQVGLKFGVSSPDLHVRAYSLAWTAMSCIWGEPFRKSIERFHAAQPIILAVGDVVTGYMVWGVALIATWWSCGSVVELQRQAAGTVAFLSENKQPIFVTFYRPYLHAAAMLAGAGEPEGRSALGRDGGRPAFDLPQMRADFAALPLGFLRCQHASPIICTLVALGDYAAAWEAGLLVHAQLRDVATIRLAYSCYQDAIFALGLCLATRLSPGAGAASSAPPPATPDERAELLGRLEGYANEMRTFAGVSPANYRPRHLLLAAEATRAGGDGLGALAAYEAACDAARAASAHLLAGLAAERAAGLAESAGARRPAAAFLRLAADLYEAWGAGPRAASLRARMAPEEAVPSYSLQISVPPEPRGASALRPASPRTNTPSPTGPSSSSNTNGRSAVPRPLSNLDWETLVNATQCISRELSLPALLERLLTVVLEIAGAQRCFLILEAEREADADPSVPPEFLIEGCGEVMEERAGQGSPTPSSSSRVEVLQGKPLSECGSLLCVRAVEWCIATERVALLQDAAGKGGEGPLSLAEDAYVAGCGVKALLALPVLHQARAVGAVYLENRLLSSAFTPSSVETLGILSSQMATSIVNARLYESSRRSSIESHAVLADAHDAIFLLGPDLRIVESNRAAERLWDRPARALRGRRLADTLALTSPQEPEEGGEGEEGEERPPPEGASPDDPLSALVQDPLHRCERVVGKVWKGIAIGGGAGRVQVEACITPFDPGARPAPGAAGIRGRRRSWGPEKAFVVFVRDVSARVRMEEQLRRIQRRWFAMITHDLRTPLNGIVGNHQLLLETRLSAEQRECAEGIGSSAAILLALMNDILLYSKLEEGAAEGAEGGPGPEPTPFDAVDLLEETISVVSQSTRAKGLELALLVPRELPRAVAGDANAFRRIVLNYCSNAAKFTPSGGRIQVRVSAEDGPTALGLHIKPNTRRPSSYGGRRPSQAPLPSPEQRRDLVTFRVVVRDTGVGIPFEHQKFLFRPYQQLPRNGREGTRMFEGTGLGLAITKRLAEAMGGAVGVASDEGAGAAFWATVVLRKQEAAGAAAWPDLRGVACSLQIAQHAAADAIRYHLRQWGAEVEAEGEEPPAGRPLLFLPAGAPPSAPVPAVAVAASEADPFATGVLALPVRPTQLARIVVDALAGRAPPASPPSPACTPPTSLTFLGLETVPPHAGEPAPPPPAKPRVLIVDDIKTNLLLLKRMLASAGLEVDMAENGEECCQTYAASPGSYCLVLLDVEMPVCDGREACRRLRAMEGAAGRVPVVFVSANAMDEDRAEAMRLGANAFVTKPIRKALLMETIAPYVGAGPPAAP